MDTTTTPAPFALDIDPRILLSATIATGAEVVGAVRPDRLDDPTPCPEFTVRQILGHLIGVLDRVTAMGAGADPMGVDTEVDGVADDAWLPTWRAAAARATEAWSSGTALGATIALPWATDTGAVALLGYCSELTVHTWDLATAIGYAPAWDDEVVGRALALMRVWLPGAGRAEIFAAVHEKMGLDASQPHPFAEVVAVPDDAPLIDQLVAWNGRRP